jgi:hypothetical protein
MSKQKGKTFSGKPPVKKEKRGGMTFWVRNKRKKKQTEASA